MHRPLAGPFHDVDILDIGDKTSALQVGFGHYLRDDEDGLRLVLDSGPLSGWAITRSADHRSLILSHGGQSLVAPPDREVMGLGGPDCGVLAWFQAIGPADLTALRDILASRWLVRSEVGGLAHSPRLVPGFGLHVGALAVDLRWNLPFDLTGWPHRLPVFPEAWRIDRLDRYQPLITYAVFGSDPALLRQFTLSLSSLARFGGYDGTILVMTDKPEAAINALVPPPMRGSVVVLPTVARDRFAYMGARLTVGDWREARRFQPILYTDADIVFDRPIAPMLAVIAQSDRLCAVAEPTEALGQSDLVGSALLLADGCAPGAELGFNFGLFGISNLAAHGAMLALIARVLQNRATMCGRDSLPFADQAIANYALYRLDGVDKTLIDPFVGLSDGRADPLERRGVVHFCWAPSAARKAEVMAAYIERLSNG